MKTRLLEHLDLDIINHIYKLFGSIEKKCRTITIHDEQFYYFIDIMRIPTYITNIKKILNIINIISEANLCHYKLYNLKATIACESNLSINKIFNVNKNVVFSLWEQNMKYVFVNKAAVFYIANMLVKKS